MLLRLEAWSGHLASRGRGHLLSSTIVPWRWVSRSAPVLKLYIFNRPLAGGCAFSRPAFLIVGLEPVPEARPFFFPEEALASVSLMSRSRLRALWEKSLSLGLSSPAAWWVGSPRLVPCFILFLGSRFSGFFELGMRVLHVHVPWVPPLLFYSCF